MFRTLVLALTAAAVSWAQGALADYQRAQDLQAKARGLVVNAPGPVTWIGKSARFWYARSVKGGTEFVLGDADARSKTLAFDHDRLAAAISAVAGRKYTGLALPFAPAQGGRGGRGATGGAPTTAPLVVADDAQSIQLGVGGAMYKCSLADSTCLKGEPIPQATAGGRGGAPEDAALNPEGAGGDPADGIEYLPPPPQQGG